MLDLNLNVASNDETIAFHDKLHEEQMDESGTSNSSIVNAEGSINARGDEDSCSTRAGDVVVFNFDILKAEGDSKIVTKDLFPLNGEKGGESDFGNWKGQSSKNLSPWKNSIDFSFGHQGGNGEKTVVEVPQQPQQKVKKSRRGPRSRSSQYRGVTFYRRTGRWESHIWDCGKQVYLGGFDTAHAAARAYDRAAIKFRGVDADINFNLSDYQEDLKQMKHLSKEEFVHILRRQSNGLSRGSLKYQGVTLNRCGRWEARMEQFLGKKAYDKAATKCNRRDVSTNFEPNAHEREMNSEANNEDNVHIHDLDLNLGISTPSFGNGSKDSRRHPPFQFGLNAMHCQKNSRERKTERTSTSSSQGLPNWAWQKQGLVTATPVPPFRIAASSGFSFSGTFPSAAILPSKPSSVTLQNLCFTPFSMAATNTSEYH